MKARKKRLRPIRIEMSDNGFAISGSSPEDASERLQQRMEGLSSRLIHREQTRVDGRLAMHGGGHPLGDGFLFLPERLLRAYEQDRRQSVLARIFRTAHRLHEKVDRIVVLHSGVSQYAARAIMEGCSQPYWNELTRGDRGSRPKVYFVGDASDNDSIQGLRHILKMDRNLPGNEFLDRWALVVIDRRGDSPEVLSLFRHFLRGLQESGSAEQGAIGELVVPVVGKESSLDQATRDLGCVERFLLDDRFDSRLGALSEECMVPAALLGINVMELLIGSAELSIQFRDAVGSENIALMLATLLHQCRHHRGHCMALADSDQPRLMSLERWANLLRAPFELPISRSLLVEVQHSRFDLLSDDSVRDEASNQQGRCPTATVFLHHLDELHLGQFMQLLMIASELEREDLALPLGIIPSKELEAT